MHRKSFYSGKCNSNSGDMMRIFQPFLSDKLPLFHQMGWFPGIVQDCCIIIVKVIDFMCVPCYSVSPLCSLAMLMIVQLVMTL